MARGGGGVGMGSRGGGGRKGHGGHKLIGQMWGGGNKPCSVRYFWDLLLPEDLAGKCYDQK